MTQVHWAYPVSGNFKSPQAWIGGAAPGASDDAIVDAVGKAYTVTAATNVTVNSIQTVSTATLAITGGAFDALAGTGGGVNAGVIAVGDAARLAVGGSVDNVGAITLTGTAHGARLTVASAGAVLSGGGSLSIQDNGVGASEIVGGILTNANNIISGHLQFFDDGLVNESAGVVNATGAVSSEIDALSAAGIVNSGTIEATGSGGVFIVSDAVDQAGGGVLSAGTGSTILLLTTVVGGTLETAGTGVIEAETATLDGTNSAVTNLGALAVVEGGALTLQGAIDNAGTISLTGSSRLATLTIGQQQATLSGGGTVFLGGGGRNILSGATAATTLFNSDNVIAGSGQLGNGRLTLVNEAGGVIDANTANGLVLDTGAGTVANAGLIEATGAAGLTIRATLVDGSAGGVIEAANGSHVGLQGATLIGGTLKSAGTGTIATFGAGNALDGRASSVISQADIIVLNASTLAIAGAIDNRGTIELGAQTASATLTVESAGATLSGGGRVTLLDSAGNRITGAASAATLTNDNNIIAGAGQLGAGSLTLVNKTKGAIIGSLATALVIDTGANTIVNDGLIEATGAGGVTVASAVANRGVLKARGGVLTLEGAVSGTGEAVIDGGALNAAGAFALKVVFGAGGGALELARSQGYTGTVWGFSKGGATSLDLEDIGFVGAGEATYKGTASSGVLTVTDGTHTAHIALQGDYRDTIFTAGSDGHGGTQISDIAASGAGTLRFIAAAAALGAEASGPMSVAHTAWRTPPTMLTRPEVRVA